MELLYVVLGLLVLYLFMNKCDCRRVEGLTIEEIKRNARGQCAQYLKNRFCRFHRAFDTNWNTTILKDSIAETDKIIPEGDVGTCYELLYNKSVRTCPVEIYPGCGEPCPQGSLKTGESSCVFWGNKKDLTCVKEMKVDYTRE